MSYPYIVQGDNVIIVIDNKIHSVNADHIQYEKLIESIKTQNWEEVKNLVDPKEVLVNYGKGKLSVVNSELYWEGKPLHNSIGDRILNMLKEGFPVDPMVNFMHNLMQNPSYRAITELYGFLERNNLPLTEDGHFLAYKKVRRDYKDCHSGTMDNSVGAVVSMNRHEVDDNPNNTCSKGLHFCSIEYLGHFGGERTMIVKVNPADVVSIPTDYDFSKARCCRYVVVGELNVSPEKAFEKSVDTQWTSVYKQEEDTYFNW